MSRSNLAAIKARLSRIRARVARLADDRWGHELSTDGDRIVIMRAVFDSDGRKVGHEAPMVLCSFGPDATIFEKELVRDAVEDLAFVLGQLTRAGEMIRDLRLASRDAPAALPPVAPAGPRTGSDAGSAVGAPAASRSGLPPAADAIDADSKNYAAEASIKCTEPAFQHYLAERCPELCGNEGDPELAAARLRRLLGIESRKQINTDPVAASRWREMRAIYAEWGRR